MEEKTMAAKEQASAKQSLTEKISTKEKVSYGCGDLASNLILVLTSTFVAYFYTDALGLNAAIIGSIMMFSRFADGVTDMLMGYVMDRVKTKYGKARPWLLWLAIPIAVACVLVFLVPNTGTVGKYVYVTITYNLVTTFLYTMINIPYGALTSLMSRDQGQRTVINVFRMFMAQVGSLIINASTLPLVNKMGGSSNQKSWIICDLCSHRSNSVLSMFQKHQRACYRIFRAERRCQLCTVSEIDLQKQPVAAALRHLDYYVPWHGRQRCGWNLLCKIYSDE